LSLYRGFKSGRSHKSEFDLYSGFRTAYGDPTGFCLGRFNVVDSAGGPFFVADLSVEDP